MLYENVCELNTWRLWGAGHVITSDMSADSFRYFRTWIVGVGKRVFETAKKDPDALGKFIDFDEDPINVDNESLEYVALEIFKERGRDLDPRGLSSSSADDEPLGFPFDLQTLAVDYPMLTALRLNFNRSVAIGTPTPARQDDSCQKKMAIPLIENRIATVADVESGKAIFCVGEGRSQPYSFGQGLPLIAEIVNEKLGEHFPVGRQVTIVQAEITDEEHVTLGIVDQNERMVCALEDVRVLE
jgi:hypothetical protein